MSGPIREGDTVFAPRAKVGLEQNHPSAFVEAQVLKRKDRSVELKLPQNQPPVWIGTSQVRKALGLLLITIGDYKTEETLIRPLGKSVLQFLRLLDTDDNVYAFAIRSVAELEQVWKSRHTATSHVILVGHGARNSVTFGVDGAVNAAGLSAVLDGTKTSPKVFVSLCCKTGYAGFAKPFSSYSSCQSIVAPFHSVHGAIASQFCQTFLCRHLLLGDTDRVAFRHARDSCAGSERFRFWENGDLYTG